LSSPAYPSLICLRLCFRSSWPLPFVPVCCPASCFPCARERELYLDDASSGMHEIKNAIRNAREHDPLYSDTANNSWDPNNPDGEGGSGSGDVAEERGDSEGAAALVGERNANNPAWNT
jgi:hypothetical protein